MKTNSQWFLMVVAFAIINISLCLMDNVQRSAQN